MPCSGCLVRQIGIQSRGDRRGVRSTVGLLPAVAAGVLLTLYFVLREANRAHVVQRSDDPLVLRFELGLYTANLQANLNAVDAVVTACDPRPQVVILDLSRLPWLTSTILDGCYAIWRTSWTASTSGMPS